MIYKRAIAKLRAQDWMAIAIELGIVIVGVFIGTWVANWNQERADKRAVERLITQLQPRLHAIETRVTSDQAYYATVRRFAKTARAGWARDPSISDRDFIIAAFQATEISSFNSNPFNDGSLLSVEEVRKVDDPDVRGQLMILTGYRSGFLDLFGEGSQYREQVRSILPDEIQQEILAKCGDQQNADGSQFWLPQTCAAQIEDKDARSAAEALRRHPELVQALTSHMAHVTRHLSSDQAYKQMLTRLDSLITNARR